MTWILMSLAFRPASDGRGCWEVSPRGALLSSFKVGSPSRWQIKAFILLLISDVQERDLMCRYSHVLPISVALQSSGAFGHKLCQ